jgi:magnesium transporter
MFKELRVSFICGLVLAVANFIKIMLFDNLILKSGISLTVSAVVCLTLALTVIIAKLVGSSLPLIAKKLRLDPAVMASPFITTIVDAISLIIYFKIATIMLGI